MGIAYLMELVLAFALGFAAWSFRAAIYLLDRPSFRHLELFAGYFLPGFGLVGGIGTWLELARRRSPQTWGAGRWAWAVTGLYLLLANIGLAAHVVEERVQGMPWAVQQRMPSAIAGTWADHEYDLGWVIAALLITRKASGPPAPTARDAREVAGRVFAGLSVGVSLLAVIAYVAVSFF